MDAILYDAEDSSQLSNIMFAAGMRLGYLIAHGIAAGGRYATFYPFVHNAKNLPDARKLHILLNDDDPDVVEKITELQKSMKQLRKVKHKNAEVFRLQRNLDGLLHKYFDDIWLPRYEAAIYRLGFMKLPYGGELTKQGIIAFYATRKDNPEFESDRYNAMSGLMMREDYLKSGITVIPMLPHEFFDFEAAKKVTVSPDDKAAEDPANLWLSHCLTFDNVLRLSDNEMMIVRRQSNESAAPLRDAVDEWDTMFVNGADAATRQQFFKEHIAVAAQALQQAYGDIEILQQLPKRSKGNRFEVYFGEVPTALMWEFYREVGVIKDQTWDVLQQKLQEKEGTPERYPVMAYKYVPPPEGTENIDDLTVASRTKKFIAVD